MLEAEVKNKRHGETSNYTHRGFVQVSSGCQKTKVVSRRGRVVWEEKRRRRSEKVEGKMGKRPVRHLRLLEKRLLLKRGPLPNATVS